MVTDFVPHFVAALSWNLNLHVLYRNTCAEQESLGALLCTYGSAIKCQDL